MLSKKMIGEDGKSYDTNHYTLSVIISVGYKVNSERAVQFRKWATTIIESFTIKGFPMDYACIDFVHTLGLLLQYEI